METAEFYTTSSYFFIFLTLFEEVEMSSSNSVAMCSKYCDIFWHEGKTWHNLPYLKVDVSVRQPVGTALIEEVDVFYEQAEERDDNLQDNRKRKGLHFIEKMWGEFPGLPGV